eukprot:CAMPEP_0171982880 /NCGR_PEP_ID=MMETSP0993-20121228/272970_1 /TAXON_ID=483369 /ORGANISM="non described non described, Strain CCMP2098" /LENGTH=685 /DNA_ID=CAMNT_0012635561 /DNA_START=176 /DNA_END=2236 /DNA_ORIENTATION=+
MAAEAQQSGSVNLRNIIARALLEHRKRGADDDVLAEAILFDEDEEIEMKRARNTWRRPGGSNATGRTDYANSTWAKMLRDNAEELLKPESAMAKVFADDDVLAEAILFDEDEEIEMKRARNTWRRPGGSNATGRTDYANSTWAKMLRDNAEELLKPESAMAKVFRRRFRVPYPIFVLLLRWTKDWHETAATDAAGRVRVPTELKLLGVLRVLGRGTCFDGIEELSGVSVSTMHSFFHKFTAWFREEVFPVFVSTPKTKEGLVQIEAAYKLLGLPGAVGSMDVVHKYAKTKEGLVQIEAAYKLLGLPGAVGSMDVVHIAWCMCPTYLANLAKGKEGYPSVAYNVVCDHEGNATAVLPGTYGATNDKTIVHFDDFVDDVRFAHFFTKFKYEVRTGPSSGDRAWEEGAWLIIDGGYHQWAATQAASRLLTYAGYAAWRKQMESVRKDIECFFGRLKGRWRILKTPISFHSKEKVDNVFFTCVALQNIIQDWDKRTRELTSWEVDADWTGSGGLFEDEEDGDDARLWCRPKLRRANKVNEFFVPNPTDDFSDFGGSSIPIGATAALGARSPPLAGETQRYVAELTSWEVDADWTGSGGLFEDEEDGDDARLWCRPKLRRANKVNEFFVPNPTDDFSDFGGSSIPIGATRSLGRSEPTSGETQRYVAKQRMLVQHHTYARAAHVVQWLRS